MGKETSSRRTVLAILSVCRLTITVPKMPECATQRVLWSKGKGGLVTQKGERTTGKVQEPGKRKGRVLSANDRGHWGGGRVGKSDHTVQIGGEWQVAWPGQEAYMISKGP